MKCFVPTFYPDFHCLMGACRHTCCAHWEIDIDEESLDRFEKLPEIREHIVYPAQEGEAPHFQLLEGEVCPFLEPDGLCHMIRKYGEDILCQICRDHPRFRIFWSDRVWMGPGLVCEEAARLVLTSSAPLRLMEAEDIMSAGEEAEPLTEDELWLMDLIEEQLETVREQEQRGLLPSPLARLKEYLLFRHLPDALYDDRVEERLAFIEASVKEIEEAWKKTDGSAGELIEIVRAWSYDTEYDEEVLEEKLSINNKEYL